jgi:choline monooxygenase
MQPTDSGIPVPTGYLSPTGLPHLLPSHAYRDQAYANAEWAGPLRSAWHVVGTTHEFRSLGDFKSIELLGEPIQIRRFPSGLVALSNVCAHRHCLITSAARGNSPTMRCQYHGWEYGEDGTTRKIPCAKDLAPIDRDSLRLDRYRVKEFGQLVFVCLDSTAPGLDAYLFPLESKLRNGVGDGMQLFLDWSVEYEANWKVAIENSLEAYHVESVHPETFRASPGEARTTHVIEPSHTAFGTQLPFVPTSLDRVYMQTQRWVLRRLARVQTQAYWQHHLFPNLLCSFTDTICLVHTVLPITPTRSRSMILQFSPSGTTRLQRLFANLWGKLEAQIAKRIVEEDIQLYPQIQKGLNASRHAGRLARSEERIDQFQRWLQSSIPHS